MKHLTSFLLLIAFSLSSQTYSPEVTAKIKQVEKNLGGWVQIEGASKKWTLEERMKYYKVHGLSIAVINNYKIEWVKGYGFADTSSKEPITPQTIFQVASIGKTINSLGVLKLAQEKKIDLYTDINNYLSSWKFPYDSISKNKKITTAQLLSHCSGASIHGFPGIPVNGSQPTITQILDGTTPANPERVRSIFEPGLKYMYSGGGTTISQLIVVDVTKQNYCKYIEETVLKPIGMDNSFYSKNIPENKKKFLATGYYRSNGQQVKLLTYPEAAGDLWSTPTDLCKYIIETQLSYLGKSNKVLSKEMTKLRLTPYIDSVGLGVFVDTHNGDKYFHHGGGNWGYGCQYYGSVEGGKGVVVMINQDYNPLLEEVINSVATVYEWKGFYNPIIKKPITVQDSVLQKYIGKYKLWTSIYTVTKRDGDYWFGSNGVEGKMYFTSEKDFFNFEFKSEKEFYRDDTGKLVGIIRRWGNEVLGLERVE